MFQINGFTISWFTHYEDCHLILIYNSNRSLSWSLYTNPLFIKFSPALFPIFFPLFPIEDGCGYKDKIISLENKYMFHHLTGGGGEGVQHLPWKQVKLMKRYPRIYLT